MNTYRLNGLKNNNFPHLSLYLQKKALARDRCRGNKVICLCSEVVTRKVMKGFQVKLFLFFRIIMIIVRPKRKSCLFLATLPKQVFIQKNLYTIKFFLSSQL